MSYRNEWFGDGDRTSNAETAGIAIVVVAALFVIGLILAAIF